MLDELDEMLDELDEMLDELDEMLDELDDAALLALWRFLYALLYVPHTGDGGGT